jgi:hypothetical protein
MLYLFTLQYYAIYLICFAKLVLSTIFHCMVCQNLFMRIHVRLVLLQPDPFPFRIHSPLYMYLQTWCRIPQWQNAPMCVPRLLACTSKRKEELDADQRASS